MNSPSEELIERLAVKAAATACSIEIVSGDEINSEWPWGLNEVGSMAT